MKYAIVIERAARNYSAYVPDLPGCIATGRTVAAVKRHIAEAIEFHLDGMTADGQAIPEARAVVGFAPTRLPRKRGAGRGRVRVGR